MTDDVFHCLVGAKETLIVWTPIVIIRYMYMLKCLISGLCKAWSEEPIRWQSFSMCSLNATHTTGLCCSLAQCPLGSTSRKYWWVLANKPFVTKGIKKFSHWVTSQSVYPEVVAPIYHLLLSFASTRRRMQRHLFLALVLPADEANSWWN